MRFRGYVLLTLLLIFLFATGCRLKGPSNATPQTKEIDPSTLRPGSLRHEQLSASQVKRIQALQQTFQEVDTSSLDQWVTDFKRDQDPEREIRIYEGMAEVYRAFCSGKKLTLPAKKEVYQVVLLRSSAPESEVLSRLQLKTLSSKDVQEILRHYKMAPAPIIVAPAP